MGEGAHILLAIMHAHIHTCSSSNFTGLNVSRVTGRCSQAAGNCGKADLAKKMYSELLQRRLQPNVYTFGSLLHGCARVKGGHQQALQYLDAMAEMGVEVSR